MPTRRALKGWAVDRLRTGLRPPWNDRGVYAAMGATALAAVNANWTRAEWIDHVMDPRNRLWSQFQTKRGKPKGNARAVRQLHGLWDAAEVRAAESPSFGDLIRDEVDLRCKAILEAVEDADAELTDSERVILRYAAELAGTRGCTVVNLPRDKTAENTGLGRRSVETALRRLSERGVLPMREKGRPAGAQARRRRANAYEVPDAERLRTYLYRGTRQVAPMAKTGSTPHEDPSSTPAKTGSTPTTQPQERTPMEIKIQCTPEEEAAILALLAEKRGEARNESARASTPADLPEGVTPIRRNA